MTPAHDTPAVIYTRVSTHKQAETPDALLAQEAECRRVCEFRGWRVLEVIREVQSGARDVRDGWERACSIAAEHGGVVVVQDTSRMSRSSSIDRIHAVYAQAQRDGYAIYALDFPEVDLTEPTGELMLTLLAAVNRFQRRMTAKKTSASLRAKVARGEPVGAPRLYDTTVIERLRDLRAQGLSYIEVAEKLNELGERTVQGSVWSKQRVYDTLKRYREG